jgi:hypothetical protein
MSPSVQGRNPPLPRPSFALPDLSPIVGFVVLVEMIFTQQILPRGADRSPAGGGVRASISALMTLRVSTAQTVSPFTGNSDSTRCAGTHRFRRLQCNWT